MRPRIYYLIMLIGIGCSGQTSKTGQESIRLVKNEPEYIWTKVLDSADWKKNYNFQMFSMGDTIWTFHPDGNWYSVDGFKWTKSPLPNSIYNLAFLDYVKFNNSIYGLGHFEGNIEIFTFRNEIYRTKDFKKWETLSRESNIPKRFFYHPFVFESKIWIIGGEDKSRKYSDIWNSNDGITWAKQKDNLNFGKRSGSQVVALKSKLYLLDNDVWSSTDGLNWELVTNEIVPGEQVFGYSAIVYDEKIWLLGCNRNGQFTSQVLVSENGREWAGQTAPWTPRGGVAATVHKGKIFMTGGKYGGTPNQPDFRYSNDVWTLERKE
ncbi:MAG: hypothetical protein JSU09_18965 [Bacteroidetes bacterium]|nr:hypothetical protein [Bacteroidota bacterium]